MTTAPLPDRPRPGPAPEGEPLRKMMFATIERMEHDRAPLSLGLIRRMMAYTRPHARLRNKLLAMVVLRSIQLPLLAGTIGAVIDGPVRGGDVPGIFLGAAAFAGLALFTIITLHFRARWALMLGELAIRDLREAVFAHLQRMTMGFFHRTKAGRIISRITSDVEAMRVGVQDVLFVSLVNLGQMAVAAVLMAYYDWMLFAVVLLLVPVLWVLNVEFRRRASRQHRTIQESFSRITSTLAESVNGIRVTQGFVREDVNAGLFAELVADHSRYNVGLARVQGVFLPLLEFNSQLFIAVLLVVGGWQILRDQPLVDLGNVVMFFFLANLFFGPIGQLGLQYDRAMAAMAGAERVFGLLDTPPDWTDDPQAEDLPAIAGRVELRDVRFAYTPNRPVLRGVTLTAEPGQMIALVGQSGGGKSTIVNLIAKFYLAQAGQVLIDGRDIRLIRSDSLHRQMGIVLQQNFLFSGTIMENIRLGRPEATDDEVRQAAASLDCLDLIESLSDGFATVVGERGSGLSLGQRQLVCFTRAMLADPRILILDEATSSIDAVTEARIQKALATLFAGRTSFVVAHRLSTIRKADSILVVDDGRIVRQGRYEDLFASNGTA
ncbi:MAG: ABC transporter ATP-binding protein [Planctomycetes bacterium]|nr:ABC transporter ATP-binding protein [Planctomycetota bacterium]